MSDATQTLSPRGLQRLQAEPPAPIRGALVVLWSMDEPERAGEVFLLPASGAAIFGRGSQALLPIRQRPGVNHTQSPLESRRISRQQLRITIHKAGAKVENVGRCPMHIGGRPADSADLIPGTIIELHSELLLMFVRRPLVLPPHTGPAPVFGQADAAGFVGEGPEAWRVRRQVATWAEQRAHVLIQGESGTGKELVARALHAAGGADRPLVTRNAATIPVALVDAELFGNRRDYPNTGMVERPGLIGAADGGVLLLDEFAELPVDSQTHLLRVMDTGEHHRLGEARSRTSRLRLVGLTNRPLSAIRRDVLARFTARIILPGLDERREDIPLIARHLLGRIDSPRSTLPMTPQLVRSLVRHSYTAHTRQLDRILHRVVLEGAGDFLDVLPDMAAPPAAPPVARDPADITAAELQAALDACGGVRDRAWRHLGLSSRHVLKRLLRKHGLVGG